ncbi:hypothetical protein [Streptomyces sp. URMC 123]|uniref:hypothetical protein n=1 Tax=Streptomyces sp. URMC 123 TaxID=3423403 RepID=UPI003F1A8BBC
MYEPRPLPVALSEPHARWATVRAERTVLGIAHNVTAATRLLDLLTVFEGDQRVHTVFTCPGSSALDTGTAEFLAARGMHHVPWPIAKRERFDIAVATSRGGDLHNLRTPLIGAPHGAGYNKTLHREPGAGSREPGAGSREPGAGSREPGAFGLTAEWLTHDGRVVPSVILLSHDEQRERLRLGCPEAVPLSVVAGDPCIDQLRASAPFRAAYREALGVRPGQRLVVVSSTWGPSSILGGTDAPVLRRALAELPADEFRVVAAVHPNAWYGHGAWQWQNWLAPLLDCGLMLPAPDSETWKAALVAADALIGDHGSLTLYGVALGIPTLLGSFAAEVVADGSPMARLGRVLPRVAARRPLAPQLAEAAAAQADDPELRRVGGLVTSRPGESAALLRRLFYDRLRLAEPPSAASVRPIPLPPRPVPARVAPCLPAAFVSVSLTPAGPGADSPAERGSCARTEAGPPPGTEPPAHPRTTAHLAARVRRFPAALQPAGHGDERLATAHLVAEAADPDVRWSRSADVLLLPLGRAPGADALGSGAEGVARRHPGCSLVVREEAEGGCLALLPDGRRLRARWSRRPAWACFAIAGSVLHDLAHDRPESAPGPGPEGAGRALLVHVEVGGDQEPGLLAVHTA